MNKSGWTLRGKLTIALPAYLWFKFVEPVRTRVEVWKIRCDVKRIRRQVFAEILEEHFR